MESISWELALKPGILHTQYNIVIMVESISWELALKPGYYTIIVQYTLISSVRGTTVFCAHTILARGRHPLPRSSAHLKSRLGKTPTYRAPLSRPKSTPTSVAGFPPPESRPGLREIPYTTTMSSLRSYGVSVPEYPLRAGVPLVIWGLASTMRTLTIWWVACGNRPQITNLPFKILRTNSYTVNNAPHISNNICTISG